MVEKLLYEASVKVLEYAKKHNTTLEKAQSYFSLPHDYLRRNRAKIVAESLKTDGTVTPRQFRYYEDLYTSLKERQKKQKKSTLYIQVGEPQPQPEYTLTVSTPESGIVSVDMSSSLINESPQSKAWENRDSNGKITSYGYRINIKGKHYLDGELSRAQMERIYALYPYNTLEVVSNEFDFLTADDLAKIARAFGIKKTKKVPKHIIEEAPEEKIAEFEVNAKLKNVTKKLEVHKSAILERQNRTLQEEIEYYRRAQAWAEAIVEKYFLTHQEDISIRDIHCVPRLPIENKRTNTNTYTLFSDIHFGKLFPDANMRFGNGTNKDRLRERCHRIAKETAKVAIENNSEEIHLICAGDLFESIIPGGMHQGQVMDLDGDEQVMFAIEVFEEMLTIINQGVYLGTSIILHGIGGNHDRIQAKREEDRKRTGTLLFYAMLEKIVKLRFTGDFDNVSIKHGYKGGIISFACDKESLSFLGHHGDSPMAKKAAEKQINLHKVGQAQNYTVLFQGHLHSHRNLDEGPNYVYLQLGAVTSGDGYSQDQICEGSQPSFIIGNKAVEGAFGFDFRKYILA